MYICNKCGKETFNSDMTCDECKSKSDKDSVVVDDIERNIEKKTSILYERKENKEENGGSDAIRNRNLMHCVDCGSIISRSALSCPKCGHPYATAEKEKKLLRNRSVEVINIVTVIIGIFFCGGFIVPFVWGIGYAIYCSGIDKEKYNISHYKKLVAENLILALMALVVAMLFLVFKARDFLQIM